MAAPSSSNPTERGDDIGNHPVSSTVGGASSVPTPANNVGGGKGWGDSGFQKGGMGSQEQHTTNARNTIGSYVGLAHQKSAAHEKCADKFDRAASYDKEQTVSGGPTCESEDHSFMEHKPGCSGTLPGWAKTKDVIDSLHEQGR